MKHLVTAVLILSSPSTAFAWIAQNGLVVEPTGGSEFIVPYRGKSGSRDFWCAAGDYVVRELGRPPGTRIYRTSSPPRRGGDGIRFSLSPEGAKKPGLFLLGDGRGVSAGHARGFCRELEIERRND